MIEYILMKEKIIKKYSSIALNIINTNSCSCCSDNTEKISILEIGEKLGYSKEELKIGLGEANLGLGCGNPVAIAELKEGETVLDLGCGAGFDAFLSALKVGNKGFVIGIDMTPEMVEKAKLNAKILGYKNVDFRFGEIENLPIKSNTIDVIISNCVINLSLNKKTVFKEALRVLKPGGRLSISDILRKKDFPEYLKNDINTFTG